MKKDTQLLSKAAEFVEKYEKLDLTACDMSPEDKMKEMSYYVQDLNYAVKSIYAYLDNLSSTIYKHMDNHLPPIDSPSKMKKAITTLGLDEDYEVQKRVIYASEGRNTVAELNFTPKKK